MERAAANISEGGRNRAQLRSVEGAAAEPDLAQVYLQRDTLEQQLTRCSQFMDDTKTAWIDVDSFITSHRTLPKEEIGLMRPKTQRVSIADFMTMCSQRSAYYRNFFLDDSEKSLIDLQFREFSRVLHAHFENCIFGISALEPENGLTSGPMYKALEHAHELRGKLGEILIKMENFMLTSQLTQQ